MAKVSHPEQMKFAQAQASDAMMAQVAQAGGSVSRYTDVFAGIVAPPEMRDPAITGMLDNASKTAAAANAYARAYRAGGQAYQRQSAVYDKDGNALTYQAVLAKGRGALAKAAGPLDVGTNTNFASISGGQSLGYVSLDTQLARGTIRPDSFALYQSLPKTQAYQVVDFWAYIDDIGGNVPGTNFTGFGNVSSGTLTTTAGLYDLQSVTLKLAANGRALTTALAAQNSFVDIAGQENANAALSILEDFDWACFWGNPTLYPNQPAGLDFQIPTDHKYNFQAAAQQPQYAGLSNDQILFNLIYDTCAQVTKWGKFGHITHAFMSQNVVASLQSLTTTLLNNIVNVNSFPMRESGDRALQGMTINGDLDGMHTRFGQVRFPVDIQIDARNVPAQAIVFVDGSSPATTSSPTPPNGVTGTVVTGATAGSMWTSAYASGGYAYVYAVASTNAASVESKLTYSAVVSSATAWTGGEITLAITPPTAADATVFRVYRSGQGYTATSNQNPAAFRYIGSVAVSGAGTTPFADLNTTIPGSSTIFLLDMDENDKAVDFRYLLPLTKIELFAQNLYMPWAVAMIGSPRVRIPKFHAEITNFVPDDPTFNPLQANANASW